MFCFRVLLVYFLLLLGFGQPANAQVQEIELTSPKWKIVAQFGYLGDKYDNGGIVEEVGQHDTAVKACEAGVAYVGPLFTTINIPNGPGEPQPVLTYASLRPYEKIQYNNSYTIFGQKCAVNIDNKNISFGLAEIYENG